MTASLTFDGNSEERNLVPRISKLMQRLLLVSFSKALGMKKIQKEMVVLIDELKSDKEKIKELSTAQIRSYLLGLNDLETAGVVINQMISVALTEAKDSDISMPREFVLFFETFQDILHFFMVYSHHLELELQSRSIDEESADYKAFLSNLAELSNDCETTGFGASVDDLF